LLTRQPTARALVSMTGIAAFNGHVFGPYGERAFGPARTINVRIHAGDVIAFFSSMHAAARILRTRPISAIVEAAKRRKARAPQARDRSEIERRTVVFARLRPWYPHSYWCLLEALALLEFLARAHVFPDWIFGVQAQPFGAHCWLEADGL